MKQIVNESIFYEAWLDTPIAPDRERQRLAKQPSDVMDCPGIHLKSLERRDGGWPKLFGRLVSYSSDKVVVISKPGFDNDDLQCVWVGDASDYERMWEVD